MAWLPAPPKKRRAPFGAVPGGARRSVSTAWGSNAGDPLLPGLVSHGFGHGVGLSQWGAYGMAEEGATAEEIVRHYFQDVEIVRLWE